MTVKSIPPSGHNAKKLDNSSQIFSIRFGLFLALMTTIALPLFLSLPLLILHWLGYPLANVGITAQTFGFFTLSTQLVGLAMTSFLIAKRLKKPAFSWSEVGLKGFRTFQSIRYVIGYYLILIGLFIVVTVILSGVGAGLPERIDGETGGTKALPVFGGFWLAVVTSVIVGPIVEEIVFRGVLFPSITKRFGVVLGVILSTLFFTLVHLDPITMMSALPLGAYLAIMYQQTKSIYPGIILHASWNLMVVLIAQGAA